MEVSEYTDKIDILCGGNKARRIAREIRQVCAILSGLSLAHNYGTQHSELFFFLFFFSSLCSSVVSIRPLFGVVIYGNLAGTHAASYARVHASVCIYRLTLMAPDRTLQGRMQRMWSPQGSVPVICTRIVSSLCLHSSALFLSFSSFYFLYRGRPETSARPRLRV